MIRNLNNVSNLAIQNNDSAHAVNFDLIVKNKLEPSSTSYFHHINSKTAHDKKIDNSMSSETSSIKRTKGRVLSSSQPMTIRDAISSFCISILMIEMLKKNNNIIDEDEQF